MSDYKRFYPPDIAVVFDLSPSAKLQLVGDLWDDIALNHPNSIPVSEELKAELERRLAKYRENPGAGLSWEEVKRNILEQSKSSKSPDL